MEFENATIAKQRKIESWKRVDEDIGSYEPLERIVKFEGGRHSASAWQAAYNYVSKAMALGGNWLSYNSFTQRVDILYVKKTQRSSFERAWELYNERQTQAEDAPEKQPTPPKATKATPIEHGREQAASGSAATTKGEEQPKSKRARNTTQPAEAPNQAHPNDNNVNKKARADLQRRAGALSSFYFKVETTQTGTARVHLKHTILNLGQESSAAQQAWRLAFRTCEQGRG